MKTLRTIACVASIIVALPSAAECKSKLSAIQRLQASALNGAIRDLLTNDDHKSWREFYGGRNPSTIGTTFGEGWKWFRPSIKGFTFEEWKERKKVAQYLVVTAAIMKAKDTWAEPFVGQSDDIVIIAIMNGGSSPTIGSGILFYKINKMNTDWSVEFVIGWD